MTLFQSFLFAIVGYFLFEKVVLPYAVHTNFKGKFAEMTKIGWLSALVFIKKCSFIAGVTFGGLWILLKMSVLLGWVFKSSGNFINVLLSTMIALNRFFEAVSENKAWVIFLLLGSLLLLLAVMNAQKHARKIYEKLKADQKEDKLSPMPEGENIKQINQNLARANSELYYLNSIPSASLDRDEKHKINWLKQIIPSLYGLRDEIDVRQRLIPEIAKGATKPKNAANWKDRILLFFTSQGLVNAVAKSSGLVGNIGIFVLAFSFVAGNGKAVSKPASEQNGKFFEWQLNTERSKLDEEWAKNLANSKQQEEEQPWSEDDEKTLNHMARSMELAFADMFAPSDEDEDDAETVTPLTSFHFRSNAIRYQIMQEYVKLPNGKLRPGFKVNEEGAKLHTSEYEPAAKSKKWSKTYANHVFNEEPTTPLGKKIRNDIRAKVKKAPHSYWNSAKAKWAKTSASFSKTAKPSEVIGMMVGEAWSDIFVGTNSSSMEASVAEKLTSKIGKSTIKAWVEFKVDKFIYHFMMGESPQDAIADLKKPGSTSEQFMKYSMDDIGFPKAANRASDVADYKPCMDFNEMSTEKAKKARAALEEFSLSASIESRRMDEAVSDFRDIFPGQVGSEHGTLASAIREGTEFVPEPDPVPSGGGGSGGRGITPEPNVSKPRPLKFTPNSGGSGRSIMAASRARSFSMLRGFRRIGGVLIGRPAENIGRSTADFRDISWEERPENSIELFLHKNNGQKISAGTFKKSIIPQSLAYAADGRLITATMIKAEPLPYLKIFTHPALTNTQIGCKAIGLDRFVDKYASRNDNQHIKRALDAFSFQSLVYEYASIQLIYNKFGSISNLLENQTSSSMDRLQFIQRMLLIEQKLIQLKSQLEKSWPVGFPLMENGYILDNKQKSHIAAKPQYYNQSVILSIQKCLKDCDGSFLAFEEGMADENVSFISMDELWKVQTEEWSGVREMQYSVDENLAFLRPTFGQNSSLFPFNFIRQIVYVPTGMGEGEAIEESDENPWEFPELQATRTIETMVWQGIQLNEKDRNTFEMMKSFTLLQRLFRCAFSGDLGTAFPVEKLFMLLAATKPYLIETETPTWNVNIPKDYEEMIVKLKYTAEALETYHQVKEVLGVNLPKNLNPCN